MHLPLLVSVVGLSLRPVFLGVTRTDEVDQCRIRFCTSIACVPKLIESVPSAMLSMFRRPRLWRALLPVLATATSTSGLPVVECVPPRSDLVPSLTMLQLTNALACWATRQNAHPCATRQPDRLGCSVARWLVSCMRQKAITGPHSLLICLIGGRFRR